MRGAAELLPDVVWRRDDAGALRRALRAGIDPTASIPDGGQPDLPLIRAAIQGASACVAVLIASGAATGAHAVAGRKALRCAAYHDRLETCRLLLEAGVDPQTAYLAGETPLMGAVSANNPALCGMMLDFGARLEDQDNRGHTALMLAAGLGQLEALRFLIARGADVRHGTSSGWTALHMGAHLTDIENARAVCTALLDAGADPDAVAHDTHQGGQRPRDQAWDDTVRDLLDQARAQKDRTVLATQAAATTGPESGRRPRCM